MVAHILAQRLGVQNAMVETDAGDTVSGQEETTHAFGVAPGALHALEVSPFVLRDARAPSG